MNKQKKIFSHGVCLPSFSFNNCALRIRAGLEFKVQTRMLTLAMPDYLKVPLSETHEKFYLFLQENSENFIIIFVLQRTQFNEK